MSRVDRPSFWPLREDHHSGSRAWIESERLVTHQRCIHCLAFHILNTRDDVRECGEGEEASGSSSASDLWRSKIRSKPRSLLLVELSQFGTRSRDLSLVLNRQLTQAKPLEERPTDPRCDSKDGGCYKLEADTRFSPYSNITTPSHQVLTAKVRWDEDAKWKDKSLITWTCQILRIATKMA
jgi:hypothetical protein